MTTGKQVGRIGTEGIVRALAFSPDGRILATGDDTVVRLHDVATSQPIGPALHHHDHVEALAFSPDGRTLAAGFTDATARLWDVATSRPVGPPLPHHRRIGALAFSPDGRTLAAGDNDWRGSGPCRLPLKATSSGSTSGPRSSPAWSSTTAR